ncbi:TetR/AcrR family transcriptional regulator [Streptomyces sp. HMX112]|uniref:TetR/AcrR family transcriptional regulator n=1 Tax=Streptomyces sp. HMX112 TaxID=3390850 RepID=UPI003A80CB30
MPTAREALLNAALAALGPLPWSAVRMVDVASAAGVSRQTLYNEFGSKEGLARALVRREAESYLRGVDRVLAGRPDAADRLVSLAEWTVGEARARPLLRALLTGCWGERLPAPRPARAGAPEAAGAPARRRADAGAPAPGDLAAAVRDRSLAALARAAARDRDEETGRDGRGGEAERARAADDLAYRCEMTVRLALSYVVAPGGEAGGAAAGTPADRGVGALVRRAVSGRSPTAGGR